MSRLSQILPIFYFVVDIAGIISAYYLSELFFQQNNYDGLEGMALAMAILLWAGISYVRRLYKLNLNNGFTHRMISYSKTYLIFSIAVLFTAYFGLSFPIPVSKTLLSFLLVFLALNIVVNTVIVNIISRWRRRSANLKSTLVVGVGDLAVKISSYFESNPDFGFRIKGYLKTKDEEPKVSPSKVLGTVKDFAAYLEQNTTDEIIIALPHKSRSKKIRNIVAQADRYGIRMSFLPDYQGLFGRHFKIIHDGDLDAINVRSLPLDEFYPLVEKGIFDFVFSLVALFFLFPVLLCIAIWIKFDSPGPVFYCPVRVGRGGKPFKIYKFRTMYENDLVFGGTRSTTKGDLRITKIGSVLRKYNLDELPQFLNVLFGDMSVVGPRPHRIHLNQHMRELYDKYMLRHYFKPGITGWAQVNGWRGPTENDMQVIQRAAHDLWYIENWSFLLDLKIIWQTMFSKRAYQNAF